MHIFMTAHRNTKIHTYFKIYGCISVWELLSCVLCCADLSFNNIEKIEGLEALTKLTDLVLFNNLITEIEGLETLQQLSALSLGNNRFEQLEPLQYLRKIPSIRVLNLDGNKICAMEDYRPFVLSHIKN